MKAPRSYAGAILIFLGVAAFFYRIMPYFSSTADFVSSSITSSLQKSLEAPSFCTKDVGEGICCELHLGAEPCLDECRKNFMDRQTFQPTKEYDECADQCLAMYRNTCVEQKGWDAGESLAEPSVSKVRRARRRPQHLKLD